ncbi:hypothetical protein EYF80_042993 [Liparis tanakae]|uniref:Uncharacterized protein n=1 Tax=Liparis tanakae TaxID=230148 RepID=A0A4Z2G2N3_9TELE|nr:hypothetical protein EYF80_042993 [Liparis tanakae]
MGRPATRTQPAGCCCGQGPTDSGTWESLLILIFILILVHPDLFTLDTGTPSLGVSRCSAALHSRPELHREPPLTGEPPPTNAATITGLQGGRGGPTEAPEHNFHFKSRQRKLFYKIAFERLVMTSQASLTPTLWNVKYSGDNRGERETFRRVTPSSAAGG